MAPRPGHLDPAKKAELRRTESTVVLASLKTWLWNTATLKSLSIGKAYAIANWERLTRFVEDARVPLDNNATERGIRGPVVGRRNHFSSEVPPRDRGRCDLLQLVETAKLHGIDRKCSPRPVLTQC